MGGRKIVLELSEHEALRLLELIKQQMDADEPVWRPYWERQAHHIQQCLEGASGEVKTEDNHDPRK
jgi:hypothetical protein